MIVSRMRLIDLMVVGRVWRKEEDRPQAIPRYALSPPSIHPLPSTGSLLEQPRNITIANTISRNVSDRKDCRVVSKYVWVDVVLYITTCSVPTTNILIVEVRESIGTATEHHHSKHHRQKRE